MWRRIHPDDRERVWGEVLEGMREQRDSFAEFRILLPDGTVKYLEANAHHEFYPPGELIEVVCTSIDVTERKRAQDEREKLRQLESDLAHMNRLSMMGELTASLAHEITQPIASARNNARAAQNFLNKQAPDLDDVREALGCVVADADRAGEIIDRIRDQVKKVPQRKECFDLSTAINEVMVLARNAIMQNGVSVQTRLAEGLFPICGDRIQLQQVVMNLILNAVEAMSDSQAKTRELSISTEQDHKGVLVAVRDSGPGIDAAHLERVRSLLHHEIEGHGDGAFDLPGDHRNSRRTPVGHRLSTTRNSLSVYDPCSTGLISGCPLLAQSGHHGALNECPLSGVKRTWGGRDAPLGERH